MACCDEYEPNVRQIDNALDCARIHSWGKYTGKPFRYCPWCGLSIEPIPCPWPVSARAELSNAERQGRHTVQWEPLEKLDESGKGKRREDSEPF